MCPFEYTQNSGSVANNNTRVRQIVVDFYLNLRWYDSRLAYRDLNTVSSLNSLQLSNMESLWIPKLQFTNALGPLQSAVGNSTTGTVIREGPQLPEEKSEWREGNLMRVSSVMCINISHAF